MRTPAGSANSTWFNSYHAYADHLQFLKDLVALSPSNSEIVTAGNSLQGNAITGIHFWGSSGKGVKPAIVFHGTVHAREWISTMVVEYFAYNLLTNYAKSSEIKGFVDKYDFYVFPLVNPDGKPARAVTAMENSDPFQASFTPSPATGCGARTAKVPRAAHVSATTSTATGHTSGP